MKNEVWKDIPNYIGLYQINNYGNVKSLKRLEKSGNKIRKRNEKTLKQRATHGYKYVILSKESKAKTFRVHRLVAEIFIPNPNNYPQVNHKDGNKANNSVDNLEWCTCEYNIKEAYRLNLCKTIKINQFDINGKYIKTWNSSYEIKRNLNLDASAITKCCKNKRKICGGYRWRYAEIEKNE